VQEFANNGCLVDNRGMERRWFRPSTWEQSWKAFTVVLAAGFFTLLDVSIVNVALPSIEQSLNATESQFQWIVAGYSLAFGLVLVPAGRLGDVFGRRPAFIAGVIAFGVTSLACGVVPNAELLVVMRLLQGAAAAIINPQILGFIQQLFAGRQRGRAFGLFGMTIGIATSIGPLLGGILIGVFGSAEGWRAVFLVNVPVCIAVAIYAKKLLPAPSPRTPGTPLGLDSVGLIIMAAAVLAGMLPFILATDSRFGLEQAPWWLLAVAVAVAVVFTVWEIARDKRGYPVVVPRALMRNSRFVFGTMVSTAWFAGWSGMFIVLTLFLQQGLGLAPWMAGALQIPIAISNAVGANRSGLWVADHGRKVVVFGIFTAMVGLTCMVLSAQFLPTAAIPWGIAAAGFITGFGAGCSISPNQTLTLAEVPVERGGTAGGVLQTMQRVGSSIGIAAETLVFFAVLSWGANRSTGTLPHLERYTNGFSLALVFVIAMLAISLVVSLVDYFRQKGVTGDAEIQIVKAS